MIHDFALNSIKTIINKDEPHNDLFMLYGHIDQEMVNSSISIIEKKLQKLNFPKTLISKSKILCVEIIQNIFTHQHDTPSIEPYFYMAAHANGLKLRSGNSVSIKNFHYLNDSFNKYKQLSKEELKALYIKQLSEGEINPLGNSGLGVLTIMTRSNKNSNQILHKVSDEEYHFGLEVLINNN